MELLLRKPAGAQTFSQSQSCRGLGQIFLTHILRPVSARGTLSSLHPFVSFYLRLHEGDSLPRLPGTHGTLRFSSFLVWLLNSTTVGLSKSRRNQTQNRTA
ncbi:UNVERIFIED_CONTAM: hypothetical protein K2H54_035238 [Gekko kuhli]